MTTAGLEPATFWYRWAIEAKRATIALGSLGILNPPPAALESSGCPISTCTRVYV